MAVSEPKDRPDTIHKEIVTLRAACKLAKRRGLWRGDVAATFPVAFGPDYTELSCD